MELCPQSGHRRVLADWIDLVHMVIASVCSRVGNLPEPSADGGKEESGASFSKHEAMTAALIRKALYLKVKSSYKKSNVFFKYLLE